MRLLGASWAILASEVRLGRRLRANWGRSGAVLGRLWRALGGVGGVRRPSDGPERDFRY